MTVPTKVLQTAKSRMSFSTNMLPFVKRDLKPIYGNIPKCKGFADIHSNDLQCKQVIKHVPLADATKMLKQLNPFNSTATNSFEDQEDSRLFGNLTSSLDSGCFSGSAMAVSFTCLCSVKNTYNREKREQVRIRVKD